MSQVTLDKFEAYRLAMELFDVVVEDMTTLVNKPALQKMISQQFGSADSIAANIEEGHGRETTKEYIRFLIYSPGFGARNQGALPPPPSLVCRGTHRRPHCSVRPHHRDPDQVDPVAPAQRRLSHA